MPIQPIRPLVDVLEEQARSRRAGRRRMGVPSDAASCVIGAAEQRAGRVARHE